MTEVSKKTSTAKVASNAASKAAPKVAAKKATKSAPKRDTKGVAPVSHGVGRRKSSVARVWLRRGNGSIVVNDKDYAEYFDVDVSRLAVEKPFVVYADGAKMYDVHANVFGGGVRSQADAVKLGISRALVKANEELRPVLREHDLLTVDSRLKERKKYGQKAARRKFQFVKR